ncbi:hypothetical protein [Methylocella sp. CPCC 101449]|uniref:hypothetical protein n=1 Tax=Methylocella sp. CPCC 101449 TaxID=2987531 RepID=UPI0028907F1E|nr:hypothetical protein [Methylocella sp. CPCC 101449]MDT2024552.1 hypothetical protein [Methylocella sp. CPCC 101449]
MTSPAPDSIKKLRHETAAAIACLAIALDQAAWTMGTTNRFIRQLDLVTSVTPPDARGELFSLIHEMLAARQSAEEEEPAAIEGEVSTEGDRYIA